VASVAIRGISADMNAVTVDGTRSASGNTGELSRDLPLIASLPTSSSRSVTKALRPTWTAIRSAAPSICAPNHL
jgi:hypothetical protein